MAESLYESLLGVYITGLPEKEASQKNEDGESSIHYLSTTDIEELYFIEDIFSYCISGKLVFNDRAAIMEQYPFTGNEELWIDYSVKGNLHKTLLCKIQKINRVYPISADSEGKSNTLEIFFVDKVFTDLALKQYSLSWTGEKKYSEIVKDITENMFDFYITTNDSTSSVESFEGWFEFEESEEKIKNFYMPYWTPLQAINWLSKRCTGSDSKSPSYVFFRNNVISNSFYPKNNFVTIDRLMKNSKMDIGNEGVYKFSSANMNFINRILSYELSSVDHLSNQNLKGGTRRGYDFSRKKFLEKEFEYKNMVPKHTMLGKKSLFDDISDSKMNYENIGINDENIIDNYYTHNWIKNYDVQQTLSITVQGHELRYAGGLIEIDWESKLDGEEINKNLSGYYLIKSITNYFNPKGHPPYVQKLVLIKNAYFESDRNELVSSSKKNIHK